MNIALIGYGKMGKTIEQLAIPRGHQIVLKIDKENLDEFNAVNFRKVDVAIEFTRPDNAFDNIEKTLKLKTPIVSGTTGWFERLDEMKTICAKEKGAFLYASNFSVGVNIFFEVNQKLAEIMNAHEQYNIKMEEVHHTQKVDAPSGTAITLAEGILKKIERKTEWIKEEANKDIQIPIVSKRIDHVPGTHSIEYISEIDTIEIKHTAHTRKGFAFGAILAAEWLVGKEGIFTMKDVLGM